MSYYISRAARAMQEAGACTTCGVGAPTRNTAGQCSDCHNAQYRERKEREAAALVTAREAGRAYWQERGTKFGDPMIYTCPSFFPGMAPARYTGTAKAGLHGPYVYVKGVGQCNPAAFRKPTG